jgi:hypothetical protein
MISAKKNSFYALVLCQETYFCLGLPWNNSTVCVLMYSWLSDDYTGPIYFIHSRKLQGLIVFTLILMDKEEPFKKSCIHNTLHTGSLQPQNCYIGLTVKGIILYRIPEFLSTRLNWVSPTSSPASECVSPPSTWVLGGRHILLRGREWGDPIQTTV